MICLIYICFRYICTVSYKHIGYRKDAKMSWYKFDGEKLFSLCMTSMWFSLRCTHATIYNIFINKPVIHSFASSLMFGYFPVNEMGIKNVFNEPNGMNCIYEKLQWCALGRLQMGYGVFDFEMVEGRALNLIQLFFSFSYPFLVYQCFMLKRDYKCIVFENHFIYTSFDGINEVKVIYIHSV